MSYKVNVPSLLPITTQRFRTVTTMLLTAAMAVALSACGDEGPQGPPPDFDFGLEVRVTDQADAPLPRVPVLLDGKVVGYTDKDGNFEGRLTDQPGTPIELGVGDLTGYRFTTNQTKSETLQVRPDIGGQLQGLPVSLRVAAQSIQNDYLIWFQAKCDDSLGEEGCADLPVMLDDKVVGRTDQDGLLHVAFKGIPGQTAMIKIDTPVYNPNDDDSQLFEPRTPTYEVKLNFDTAVYVLEQDFTDPAAKTRPTRRVKRAPRAKTSRPAAKTTTTKKTTRPAQPAKPKEEKKPGREIIDLF